MKSCFAIGLFAAAASCFAASNCPKPEYAELKDMTKSELSKQYCSATRGAALNEKEVAMYREMVRKLAADGVIVSKHADIMDALSAATSCSMIAASAEEMLAKRFKAKPPSIASCY